MGIGNSLMLPTPTAPLVRSVVLSSSSATLTGLPSDAVIQGAYFFWSASYNAPGFGAPTSPDPDANLMFPDGTTSTVLADTCFQTPASDLDGAYYCRADITTLLAAHTPYNGVFTASGIDEGPGHIDPSTGQCEDSNCQAKYGGWSLVVVYSSPTAPLKRDINLYDGFDHFWHLDGPSGSLGWSPFSISGFLADNPARVHLSYFALEGDAYLGDPPQDSDPVNPCTDCWDFFAVNGTHVYTLSGDDDWTSANPPGVHGNNIFNEDTAPGVDIDTFDLGASGLNLVKPGDTSANLMWGSGDSTIDPVEAPGGGGESVYGGWILLTINRPAPNFSTANTNKTVTPSMAATGDQVFYSVQVTNDGSQTATNVNVSDLLPAGVSLVPGTLTVDGVACPPGPGGGVTCTAAGSSITVQFASICPNKAPGCATGQHHLTFIGRITSATKGSSVCNTAAVASDQTPSLNTNQACVTITTPTLGQATKIWQDLTNPSAPQPGDTIQYTIQIPSNGPMVPGVSFNDSMPPHLHLVSVTVPPGAINASTTTGGANGTGQVIVSNITVPAMPGAATITVNGVLDPAAGFGATPINGYQACNQGDTSAPSLVTPQPTDDPTTRLPQDPTCFALVYDPDMSGSTKTGVDDQGHAQPHPGDTITYTVSLVNKGDRPGTINLQDNFPLYLTNIEMLTSTGWVPLGISGGGGWAATFVVNPGTTTTVEFRATVSSSAPNGAVIQNSAPIKVAEDPTQNRTLTSSALTVLAAPDLSQAQKTVVDTTSAGAFQPGDTVQYTITIPNAGDEPATGVTVLDKVDPSLVFLSADGGGAYSAATDTVTWSVGSLAAGATAILHFSARIVSPLANGTAISNQATIDSTELPPQTTTDPSTGKPGQPTVFTVASKPIFSVNTKTVVDTTGSPTQPGDTLAYTITYKNTGTETATNTTVTDAIDPNATFVSADSGGAYNAATRTVTWTVGAVAPGDVITLRLTTQIAPVLPNGTVIANQGFLHADQLPATGLATDDPRTPAVNDPTDVTVVASPNLSRSTKVAADATGFPAQPGDTVTYTITWANTGNAPVRSPVVTDLVDKRLTRVTPADGGTFNAATGTLTWSPAGPLVPGSPVVEHFTATLVKPLPNGTNICNQGQLSSPDLSAAAVTDDPSTPTVGDPTCYGVVARPEFGSSTKTVTDTSGSTVHPGDTLAYTLAIDNTGTADATNVTVTDPIDPNLTAIVPADGGSFNAATRTITWTLPALAVGASRAVHFTAQVVKPLDNGTVIANQGQITSTELATPELTTDPSTGKPGQPTRVTVVSAPDFSRSAKTVTDASGGLFVPGDTVSYTIVVDNQGNGSGTNVVVTDAVPAGLTSIVPGQGGQLSGGTLTWNQTTTPALARIGVGAAFDVTLTFTAKIGPVAPQTTVCNQGSLGASELTAPQHTDDPRTPPVGDPTCFTSASPVSLTATKTVVDTSGAPARPGHALAYTISVTNTGSGPAHALVVTDPVSSLLTSVAPGQGGQLSSTGSGGTITWNQATTPALAQLAAGATATLTFTAQIVKPLDNGTVISNQGTVTTPDLALPTLTDDPSVPGTANPTNVTVTSAPDLSTSTKTAFNQSGGVIAPGDTILYTITLLDTGDAVAHGVTVTDPVDANLTAVTPMDGGTYDASTRTIHWAVANVPLAPGGATTVRFTANIVKPLAGGTVISNQGTVSVAGQPDQLTGDPSAGAHTPTRITVQAAPDFSTCTKSVADGTARTAAPGDTLTYTIDVHNAGNAVGHGVTVTDAVPAQLTSITPQDGGAFNPTSGVVTWTLASVSPGPGTSTDAFVHFTAKVKPDVRDGSVISNQARIASTETPAPQPTGTTTGAPGNHDPTTITVSAIPALTITKTAASSRKDGLFEPGDTVTYTLTLTDAGPAYAYDVQMTDVVDANLTAVKPGQGGALSGGTITWNKATTPVLAEVAPGTPLTLSFTGVIRSPLANATTVANQSLTTAAGVVAPVPSDDPSTPAKNDPTVFTVTSRPDLGVSTKTVTDMAGRLPVQAGDTLLYTIKVTNGGTEAAENARLSDVIPPYTTYVKGSTTLNGAALPDAAGGEMPFAVSGGVQVASPGDGMPGELLVGAANAAIATFQVQVGAGTPAGSIVSNQGFVSDSQATVGTDDPTTATKGDPTRAVVGGGPILKDVVKTYDPSPFGSSATVFGPGDLIQYHVTIENTGTAPATNVRFEDDLPSNVAYAPGSLVDDATPLPDGDVKGNDVVVTLPSLAAHVLTRISFRARILSAPGAAVVNQGVVTSTETPPELTDSDGDESNGNQPTVTPIGAPSGLAIAKSVFDVNGGSVQPGDELLYQVWLANNDPSHSATAFLSDDVPAFTQYETGTAMVPGGTVSFAPAPAGASQRGTLSAGSVTLGPGDSIELQFRVQVDAAAANGTSICNVATAGQPGAGSSATVQSNRVCALVGAPLGTSAMNGVVYEEASRPPNGQYDPGVDLPLPGFTVQLFRESDTQGPPAASAVADSNGNYQIGTIPPGRYTARVLSDTGVEFTHAAAVTVAQGMVLTENLPVDPSGRIYSSSSGQPVAGAQAFLYYDATDRIAPNTLVPAGQLGVAEQGQRTGSTGLYYFDVQPGRRYALQVLTAGTSFAYPSTLIPPHPGFAPAGPVAPDAVPSLKNPQDLVYYTRFDIADQNSAVTNNHIPVDTLSSLISLDKRADRVTATVGDTVTYTLTVKNGSAMDLTAAKGDAVTIEDVPPAGFAYEKGHAARVRETAGQRTPDTGSAEPVRRPGALDFGPFDLPAGATVTIVYQESIGLRTRLGLYTNTAILLGPGGRSLSNPAQATVRVENDPIFDDGLVFGRVFCDSNQNGVPDPGEEGIAGARVYVDTGSYSITDPYGKYHLSELPPGIHYFKLDVNTLPPGSEPTSPIGQVIYFTRGLPAKANFGVACHLVNVTPTDVAMAKGKPPQAPPRTTMTLAGDLAGPTLSVDGQPVTLWSVDAELVPPPAPPSKSGAPAPASAPALGAPNLPAPGRDGLSPPASFELALRTAAAPVRGWRLTVSRVDDVSGALTPIATLEGRGTPPAHLTWDGRQGDRVVAATGAAYAYQLTVVGTDDSLGESPVRAFGVAYGVVTPAGPTVEDTITGDLFRGKPTRPTVSKGLRKKLLADAAKMGPDDTISVEVHAEHAGRALAALAATQEQAAALRDLLVHDAKVDPARIHAAGRGFSEPAPPRAHGRAGIDGRVVVRILPKPRTPSKTTLPAIAPFVASALVDGEPTPLDGAQRFERSVPIPPTGRVPVELQRPDGLHVVAVVARAVGPDLLAPAFQPPAEQPATVAVTGSLAQRVVTIGGQRRTLELLDVDAYLAGTRTDLSLGANGKLARMQSFRLSTGAAHAARWTLSVAPEAGNSSTSTSTPIWVASGEGAPPPELFWNGTGSDGKPALARGGAYRYRLVVEDTEGGRGESPARTFTVERGGQAAAVTTAPAKATGGAARAPAARHLAGALFDGRGKATGLLKDGLAAFVTWMGKRPAGETYSMSLGVAVPRTVRGAERVSYVGVRAAEVRAYLKELGVAETRYHLDAALAPGAKPGQDTIEIAALGAVPVEHAAPAGGQTAVRIDGTPVAVDASGAFSAEPAVEPGAPVIVDVTNASGQRAVLIVKPSPASQPAPASEPVRLGGLKAVDLGAPRIHADREGPVLSLALAQNDPGAFGQKQLDQALGEPGDQAAGAAGATGGGAAGAPPPPVEAASLKVQLPPRGLPLGAPSLQVRGHTVPTNKITVNGAAVKVRRDGEFVTVVDLPYGKSTLKIQSTDAAGDVATIEWPVEVSTSQSFLLGLVDTAAATAIQSGALTSDGAALDGFTGADTVDLGGRVLLHGRVALYYKGHIRGDKLFKDAFITAHVDTAKQTQFSEFFDEVIDPNRTYSVYGDSSTEVRDAQARGKLYVLVQVDDSKLLVGNFRTGIKGLELLSYNRTVYGAEIDFARSFLGGRVKPEVKAFGSYDDVNVARDHDVFRATGGSIYYLRHGLLRQGAEQVRMVVRDRDSGLPLLVTPMTRDVDYTIDYPGGRILFKNAIPSVADAASILSNPAASFSTLQGNPVYIEADYEYDTFGGQTGTSMGVQAKTKLFDVLEVGAAYVGEQRPGEATPGYRLYGADATYAPTSRTFVKAEVARSESFDAQSFLSMDGGITFTGLTGIAEDDPNVSAGGHNAYKLELRTDLSDYAKSVQAGAVTAHAYAQDVDRGFYSSATTLDQGRKRFGGDLQWRLDPRDVLSLRNDDAWAQIPVLNAVPGANPLPGQPFNPLAFQTISSTISTLQYDAKRGTLDFKLADQLMSQDNGAPSASFTRDTLGGQVAWNAAKRWTLRLGQEGTVYDSATATLPGGGAPVDPQFQGSDAGLARLMTTAGVDYKLSKDFALTATGAVRWNGDNSLQAGLKTALSDSADTYVQQRLTTTGGESMTSTVVGGEQHFGNGDAGRAYGEYQIDEGMVGLQNRAVLGVGHKFQIFPGLNLTLGYEHQQTFAGHLPDGTSVGSQMRDVGSVGYELLSSDRLKLGGRFELRYDNGGMAMGGAGFGGMSGSPVPGLPGVPGQTPATADPRAFAQPTPGATGDPFSNSPYGLYPDRTTALPGQLVVMQPGRHVQVLTSNGADLQVTESQHALLRLNFSEARNEDNGALDARYLEATAGWAIRPIETDLFNLLAQASAIRELRPVGFGGTAEEDDSYLVSVLPVLELPLHLQLVEKVAYKHTLSSIDVLPGDTLRAAVDTLLWINHVNYHLGLHWDAGAEYRFLAQARAGASQVQHGALLEIDYRMTKNVRVGAGWNFTYFSDNEYGDLNVDAHGFFLRVTGTY